MPKVAATQETSPRSGIVILALCIIAMLLAGLLHTGVIANPLAEKPVPADWRPPVGYTLARTDNVGSAYGYRWEKAKGYECSFSGNCWRLDFVSSKRCKGFSVTASLLDKSQTVIGTNYQQHISIPANQKYRLIFQPYPEVPETLKIVEAACWL